MEVSSYNFLVFVTNPGYISEEEEEYVAHRQNLGRISPTTLISITDVRGIKRTSPFDGLPFKPLCCTSSKIRSSYLPAVGVYTPRQAKDFPFSRAYLMENEKNL
jgi:hypothetical protein